MSRIDSAPLSAITASTSSARSESDMAAGRYSSITGRSARSWRGAVVLPGRLVGLGRLHPLLALTPQHRQCVGVGEVARPVLLGLLQRRVEQPQRIHARPVAALHGIPQLGLDALDDGHRHRVAITASVPVATASAGDSRPAGAPGTKKGV